MQKGIRPKYPRHTLGGYAYFYVGLDLNILSATTLSLIYNFLILYSSMREVTFFKFLPKEMIVPFIHSGVTNFNNRFGESIQPINAKALPLATKASQAIEKDLFDHEYVELQNQLKTGFIDIEEWNRTHYFPIKSGSSREGKGGGPNAS